MTFVCFLPGVIPAKKNGKMLTGRRIITAPKTQAAIAGITSRLLAARVEQLKRLTLARFTIELEIRVSNLGSTDPDNCATTLLDSLREAGVIVNDNPNHSRHGRWDVVEVERGQEGVNVTVIGEPQ